MDEAVNVDLFQTEKIHVSGKDGSLKQEVERCIDGFRNDPHFSEVFLTI